MLRSLIHVNLVGIYFYIFEKKYCIRTQVPIARALLSLALDGAMYNNIQSLSKDL